MNIVETKKGKEGRPISALTPELIKNIEVFLKEGNYVNVVCKFLGIDERSFYRWLKKGEKQKSGLYGNLCQSVKKAESAAEILAVRDVKNGDKGWTSRAWFLERKFKDRWGRDNQNIDQQPTQININPVVIQPIEQIKAENAD